LFGCSDRGSLIWPPHFAAFQVHSASLIFTELSAVRFAFAAIIVRSAIAQINYVNYARLLVSRIVGQRNDKEEVTQSR